MRKGKVLLSETDLVDLVMKSIIKAAKGVKPDDSSPEKTDSSVSMGPTNVSDSEYKEKVIKLLSGYEGFREKAYRDAGRYAIGYGSTYVDGVPVKAGDRITREKALRQKSKDIDKFKNVIIRQIGQTAWNKLDMDTRVVLTSIAYNYGRIPSRLLDAVKKGDKESMHTIIKNNLSQDNAGINRGRREDEALVLAMGQSKKVPNYDV